MASETALTAKDAARWQSLAFKPASFGYSIQESAHRFSKEAVTEMVLRLAGILILNGVYLVWLFPGIVEPIVERVSVTLALLGTGIFIYAFGTRGFRNELRFMPTQNELRAGRLNLRDQVRISRNVPLGDIESIFVKRAKQTGGSAVLSLRLRGRAQPIAVLRGRQSELEQVHQGLTEDIRAMQTPNKARKGNGRQTPAAIRPGRVAALNKVAARA